MTSEEYIAVLVKQVDKLLIENTELALDLNEASHNIIRMRFEIERLKLGMK